jgi:hypothetical protein
LLFDHVEMLTWTDMAAYLSVVVALWGGGVAACYLWLWRK